MHNPKPNPARITTEEERKNWKVDAVFMQDKVRDGRIFRLCNHIEDLKKRIAELEAKPGNFADAC